MSSQGERFGEINFDITDCLLCGKILSGVGFFTSRKIIVYIKYMLINL